MTSIKTFNDCMEEFLTDLKTTFPDQNKLKVQYQKFYTLKKTNPRKVVERFMESIEDYKDVIVNKDETPVMEEKIPFLNEMNVKSWWATCSEQTKESIWKYLNTLLFIGNAINSIPEDMMEGIERIAKQCAEGMTEQGNTNVPDFGSMMSSIQNMMGPMMSQLEEGKSPGVTKKQKLKNQKK